MTGFPPLPADAIPRDDARGVVNPGAVPDGCPVIQGVASNIPSTAYVKKIAARAANTSSFPPDYKGEMPKDKKDGGEYFVAQSTSFMKLGSS
jgi:hypothetical protein